MIKRINIKTLQMSAAFFAGVFLVSSPAFAAAGGNDFSKISGNIIQSIQDLPGLLTGLSYMFGILLGVLGILKIKDHVENPQQTALKDGAIRLAAGGGLFALPIIFESMLATIGVGGPTRAAVAAKVDFIVN